MTVLGKAIITAGIAIFTVSTLIWIIHGEWQWFAGGGTIFLASVLTAAVVSAETKPTTQLQTPSRRQSHPSTQNDQDTQELPVEDDWTPPNSPPPDEVDPFDRPPR